MKKITYKDKAKSNVNIDSPLVVLAEDANEIKEVVNALVIKAQDTLTFSEAARFIGVIIPESLFKEEKLKDSSWSVVLVLSSSPLFTKGTCVTIDSSSPKSSFWQFSDGLQKFIKFSKASIGDSGSVVYADLNGLDLTGKYFARFTFSLLYTSKKFDGLAIGAIGYEDSEELSSKLSRPEGKIKPLAFELMLSEIEGQDLAYEVNVKLPGEDFKPIDESFSIEAIDISSSEEVELERNGSSVRISRDLLAGDFPRTLLVRAYDSFGTASVALLSFDPEVNASLGDKLTVSSPVSALKSSQWSLEDIWSRSQPTPATGVPVSEDILFSAQGRMVAKRAHEDGKAVVAKLPSKAEKILQIKPESITSVKLIDVATGLEAKEFWSTTDYSLKAVAVMSDGQEIELPEGNFSIEIEGASRQFIETDGHHSVSVKDVRDRLVSFVLVRAQFKGLEKTFTRPVVVIGSALSKLEILGPTEVRSGQRAEYTFLAKKTDGYSFKVFPQELSFSADSEGGSYDFTTDNVLSSVALVTRDTLWDYTARIEGKYTDPSYDDEHAEGYLDISVKGGFTSAFEGKLYVSDGSPAEALSFSAQLEVPTSEKPDAQAESIMTTFIQPVGFRFQEKYPLALEVVSNEKPMKIQELVAVCLTATGAKHEKKLAELREGYWILEDGMPELAVELESLKFTVELKFEDYI